MGPISAFPMAPSTPAITISAAGDAARELKRGKSSSGRAFATSRGDEERLKRRSNRMRTDFQGAMEKSVSRKLNSMSGSQNNRKLGLKVAQFIPGKGLEVAGAQVENDPSIYCSLGLKGEKHVDPLDETFARIKGRQVSMDFAFKLVNDTSSLLDHDKDTRVTTMNCFRHVNPDSFNYDMTGWHNDVSISAGWVQSITVVTGGEYSEDWPNSGVEVYVTIYGGGGSGAEATCTLEPIAGTTRYEIVSYTITKVGSGYTSVPSLSLVNSPTTVQHVLATGLPVLAYFDLPKSSSNFSWHSTLGPDASLIRVGTSGYSAGNHDYAGTWRGPNFVPKIGVLDASSPPTGHVTAPANTLMSPFRYPNDMEIMFSRVNRQLLENYGWLLNPFKFINPSANSKIDSPEPKRDELKVWSNPGANVLDFTDVSHASKRKNSYPAKINIQSAGVVGQQALSGAKSGYEWHSQLGPGKLSYQFSNDGTNPVCIDICVVGIKKDSPVPVHLLEHICDYNYAVHKFANKNSTDLNGFQASNVVSGAIDLTLGSHEWHKNAKLPFMPNECFKNPQSYLSAVGDVVLQTPAVEVYDYLQQGKKNPFKVVKRDQFIVSSGSSRAWNTTLPSIKYRPDLYDDVEYPLVNENIPRPDSLVTTADEYTFVLCIGASGMPKPVEEIYSSTQPTSINSSGEPVSSLVDAKAIIDRQPSTCNVSVVGTYKETIYPTYPQDRTDVNFINGRLTEPYFTNPPGLLVPITDSSGNPVKALKSRVNTVDISQLGQVVHTSPDGIVGVGAITTEIGA